MPDIQIYGGGMAGLTAAYLLEQRGKDYQLFESQSHWGGKLQTTHLDGFVLDHGFQVIQSAYPALELYHRSGFLNDALAFGSGAWLLTKKGKTLLADPLREFPRGLASLGHPSIKLTDGINVIKLRNKLIHQSPDNFFSIPASPDSSQQTTLHYLTNFGFSQSFIEAFFRPFFTGIFLEEALKTPYPMFQFVFWALAKGKACLLPQGIQTLPNRIVATLNSQRLHLNCAGQSLSTLQPQRYFGTQVHYFEVNSDLGLGKFIALNATPKGPINLMAIPSKVQKSYAPAHKHLLCVSLKPHVIHETSQSNPSLILHEVETLLQSKVEARWLQSFHVPQALPSDTPYTYGDERVDGLVQRTEKGDVVYAVGQTGNPSLNAAILRGMSFVEALNL